MQLPPNSSEFFGQWQLGGVPTMPWWQRVEVASAVPPGGSQ